MTLKEAINKDIFIIDKDSFNDDDLNILSLEALENLKLRIHNKVDILSTAIKAKQIEYTQGGEGFSQDWYINHRRGLSINQRALMYVNMLIKSRRRSECNISEFFMDQAKIMLLPEQFDSILRRAQAEMQASHGK